MHFTDPRFAEAATRPAAELSQGCREMLTSRGFTTVVDLGSFAENTGALQKRQPTLDCPRIIAVGLTSFPVDGVPIYVKREMGEEMAAKLPQPRTAEEAAAVVRESVGLGAGAIKIFTGTWLGGRKTAEMKLEVVRGATEEAHRAGLLVFAHPQTDEGLRVAMEGGVDVLAHTVPNGSPWSPERVKRLVDRKMALAPTLSLWRVEMERAQLPQDVRDAFIAEGLGQLRAFVAGKGEVLFGTDVGYIPEAGADEEVARMTDAGMGWATSSAAWARRRRGGSATRAGGCSSRRRRGRPGPRRGRSADGGARPHPRAPDLGCRALRLRSVGLSPTSRKWSPKTWGVRIDR